MKVTDYIIRSMADEKKYIYLNTLNGAIDIVESEVDYKMQLWKNHGIDVKTDEDEKIYKYFHSRGYILDLNQETIVKKNIYERLKNQVLQKQQKIENAIIVLTYNCNFRCPYCYEKYLKENGESWTNKIITNEMVDKIFNLYENSMKHITLFGGEPLLESNRNIIEYILRRGKNLEYSIVTNGYNLAEFLPLLKNYKFRNIEVTLDGNKEKHNRRRFLYDGGETFDRILDGISKALQYGINITLRMNIDEDNYEECEMLANSLLEKHKHARGTLSIFRNPIFGNKKICRSQLFTHMFLNMKNGEDEYKNSNQSLGQLHPIINAFTGKDKWRPKYVYCKAHLGSIFFDPHGDTYSCWLAVGDSRLKTGEYYPNNLSNETWNKRNVENIPKCSTCNKALFCGGGCAKVAFETHGEIFKEDCSQTQLMINKIIPILYSRHLKK